MAKMQLSNTAVEGDVVEVTPGRILKRINGGWKIHRASVAEGQVGVNVDPIFSDQPPPLPGTKPFWMNTQTMKLYVRYNDGDSLQWVEV